MGTRNRSAAIPSFPLLDMKNPCVVTAESAVAHRLLFISVFAGPASPMQKSFWRSSGT